MAGALLLLLSACNADVATPNVPISAKSDAASHPHPVKPGAAVKLENSQPFFLAGPGAADLELVLSAPVTGGLMQVGISTSAGLELVSAPAYYEFPLGQGTEYKLPIQIRAVNEGRYYINLQVSIARGEQRDQRIITAIVQVGAPVMKAQKAATGAAVKNSEDKVISQPAQETIQPAH